MMNLCHDAHWSRAFKDADNGGNVERGGNDNNGSAREGKLVDSRGREVEASMQQTSSK